MENNPQLNEQIIELLNEQIKEWDLCKQGYESLNQTRIKEFHLDKVTIKVQFNPVRMTSTSARVDQKSISERKCFLCKDNLPQEQRFVKFNHNFIILCNPFPIFPQHFTIPSFEHKPQKIVGNLESLLDLSYLLRKDFIVFYNGPKCGASAPDHLHFQAGTKIFLPIYNEIKIIKENYSKIIFRNKDKEIYSVDDTIRKFILIESNDKEFIISTFNILYDVLQKVEKINDEPLMNILSFYENEKWHLIFFLRKKHRPSYYFFEDERKILLSPAAVDIGGVCITPREEDFNKIIKENLQEIFNEVMIDKKLFNKLIILFQKYFD
ncbi:MAG: DUF4922 domain-containing protein [Ignavibacterium sp.]